MNVPTLHLYLNHLPYFHLGERSIRCAYCDSVWLPFDPDNLEKTLEYIAGNLCGGKYPDTWIQA